MTRRSITLFLTLFLIGFFGQYFGVFTQLSIARRALAPAQEVENASEKQEAASIDSNESVNVTKKNTTQDRDERFPYAETYVTTRPAAPFLPFAPRGPLAVTKERGQVLTLRREVVLPPSLFSLFGLNVSFETPFDAPLQDDTIPLAASESENAQDEPNPYCSKWAKFKVGAWIRKRTTSITYENNKPIQSVTETRVELKKIDLVKKCYELNYVVTVKVGDVDYSQRNETALFDFFDLPYDESAQVENTEPVNLMIAQRVVPCQTRRVTRVNDQYRETTVLWFSLVLPPYVMQREVTRERLDANSQEGDSFASHELFVVQQTATRPEFGVVNSNPNYVALSSSNSGKRSQTSKTIYSLNIPGGVIRENSVEKDPETGAVIYQTNSVLLDYYVP